MSQAEVRFDTVDQIRSFVNAINQFDTNFEFHTVQGTVNAKSILGVFALDFSQPLYLRYDSDDQRIQRVIRAYLRNNC